jgi:RimJ/RimL family protein N-acetyltransferase
MIRTARLVLRRFTDSDRTAFASLNADERVMATIGPVMSREQSDAFLDRIEVAHAERGFGLWCVEVAGECIGFTGLSVPWFRDGVEIGWRIRSGHWGHGYATEAADASLVDGFERIGLTEVISFTAASNVASRRVMEKLGMRRDPDGDFDHPSMPDGHPLRPHVLYRLTAEQHATRAG